MKYWNKVCGFVMIFILPALFSAAQIVKNSTLYMPANRQLESTSIILLSKNENRNSVSVPPFLNIINGNHYTQYFGFVCKKELLLQKAIKVPLYIRLGSLQQCNYLERKR